MRQTPQSRETPGPYQLLGFLRGDGPDGRGRSLQDVLAFDDDRLEAVHDYIQWLFPLAEPSRAVPGAPVLSPGEAEAIRDDMRAQGGLHAALARMTRFYQATDGWLVAHDHNHLRISRIIAASRALLGRDVARGFHDAMLARNADSGAPVNRESLRHWSRALG